MLCQSCGKRPANTHIKTIINGESHGTLTLFRMCAKNGIWQFILPKQHI